MPCSLWLQATSGLPVSWSARAGADGSSLSNKSTFIDAAVQGSPPPGFSLCGGDNCSDAGGG